MSMSDPYVICPHCDGDGEEPGAPMDVDGDWICTLCDGSGRVRQSVAEEYEDSEV